MRLTYQDGKYIAETRYEERMIPKRAGFRWDREEKHWWTDDVAEAICLIEYADEETRLLLETARAERETAKEASRATDADVEVPAPEGLAYLPFQRAGIAYAISRPATLIGDEMGLGKTVQALGVVNADPTVRRVLVICPASLKLNWQREAERWLARPMTVAVADGKALPAADVLIINYDVLHRHEDALQSIEWDLLIVDECHYVKNPKARRSKQVYGIKARRRLFLTGTPIVNRPIELWPIISHLDPQTWPGRRFWWYAKRYASAYNNGWGWDFRGASRENLPELQERLRSTIMVRRLKSQVLTELPPKVRQVIELPANGAAAAISAEREAVARNQARLEELKAAVELAKASDDPEEYQRAVQALKEGAQVAFEEMSRRRHDTAVAKVPYVIEHMREVLDAEDAEGRPNKIVVFAHHKDVVRALADAFAGTAVTLTGDTPLAERQRAVDAFQNDPAVRVFIGSITAAGVGLTLTASSHVIFAELDWVPGNLSQAEDRCHRIGQRDSVLVQHLVLEGSLDATMARTLVRKQEVIDRALDREAPVARQEAAEVADEPAIPLEEPVTASASRHRLAAEAEFLTDEQVAAVHEALRILARVCDGAVNLDEMGFNALDTRIGHSLAAVERLTKKQAALGRKIVRKYWRQLPEELLASITGREPAGAGK